MSAHTQLEAEPRQHGRLGDYLGQLGATPLLTAREEVELARRIEAGVYAAHLIEEGAADGELGDVVADGRAARDHMIRANLRLVVSIARRYAHQGMSFADVIQDGNVGLIQAVERFDHARGNRFSTFGTWWIRKAIQQGLERAHTVRLPASVRAELHEISRAEATATLRLGRTPTEPELAEEAGQEVSRLRSLRRFTGECVSLDTSAGEGLHQTTLGDLLEDTQNASPEQLLERKELRGVLDGLVDGLAPRQVLLMRLRFGLNGYAPHTPKQVADRLGLTGQWVRQLERESLAWIRDRGRCQDLRALAC